MSEPTPTPCEDCDATGHDRTKFCPANGWDDLRPDNARCHPCPYCGGSGLKGVEDE